MWQFLTTHKKIISLAVLLLLGVGLFLWWSQVQSQNTERAVQDQLRQLSAEDTETMLLAGGCFWCVEADMEKASGVVSVVSGYSGGSTTNPTYDNYAAGGHREVVRVTYNPNEVSYRQLLYYFIKHIDPTDGEGSFVDRGVQYSPAIYYETEAQKQTAQAVLADIAERDVFSEQLQVLVRERQAFWRAEEYHQDFYKKNPVRYGAYRRYSGRDSFIQEYWGQDNADTVPPAATSTATTSTDDASTTTSQAEKFWQNYQKPDADTLKKKLSPGVYKVTQEDDTESAYDNELWDETRQGIYVDVLSGEPLFSSKHKYKSGTGWPSFTQPLEAANIVAEPDYLLGYRRTEVRSNYGDNHLGHVFDDGSETLEASGGAAPTGLRYCLNSAALEFIPRNKMAERGYGEYLSIFTNENQTSTTSQDAAQ